MHIAIASGLLVSITTLLARQFHLVEGCPFATEGGGMPENHPELHVARRTQEGFFEPDGSLIGSPSQANGAVALPPITQAVDDAECRKHTGRLTGNRLCHPRR